MGDDAFGVGAVVATPEVAHGLDVAGGVVVEVVLHPAVGIVEQAVIARVGGCAHINAVFVDGGNSPEVSGDEVTAQLGFAGGVGTVDTDTAASVHRVGLQIIVLEGIILYEGLNSWALLGIAVPVVDHRVAPDGGLGMAHSQQVGDGDAARHRGTPFNVVVLNDNGVAQRPRPEVDLGLVDIVQHVVIKGVVPDFGSPCHIGRRADDRFPVLIKIAVLDDRAGVGVFDALFLEIAEHAPFKCHLALHHLDVVAVFEQNIRKTAVCGAVEADFVKFTAAV